MQNLQGGFMVLSRWMEKDVLRGFLFVDTTYHLQMVPIEVVQAHGYLLPYLNAQYDAQFKTLVGTHGSSLTDYPAVDHNYILQGKNGIVVMSTVVDKTNGKPIGVVAFNGIGTRFNLTYKKLNELLRKYPACNFKMVVDKKYGNIAVRKDGSYFDTVEVVPPGSDQRKAAAEDKCVSISSAGAIPVMGVYNLDSMRTGEFGHSCQEKLVLTMVNMQKLTPYYYTILQAIKRKPAPMGSMGVTEDTLYYDQKFVANLTVPELTFVLIHEIMHLAMQHPSRFGTRTRADIWNIATDLYINSIICNDFKVRFGQGVVDYRNSGQIKTPDFGIYIETIDEKIDLAIDTPETIYERLMKENNNGIPMPSAGGGQGKPQKGQQGNQQNQAAQAAQQLIQEGIKQVQQGAQRAQQECGNKVGSQQAGNQIGQGLKEIADAVNQAAKAASQPGQQGQANKQSAMNQAQQGMQQTQQGVNGMNQALQATQQAVGNPQNPGDPSGSQGSQGSQMSPQEQMQRGINQIQQGLMQLNQSGKAQPGQGQPGQGQPGQGQGGQGQPGQGQPSQGQSGQGQPGQGQPSNIAEDDFSGDGEYESMQQVEVIYNGKKLTGTIMRDVMSSNDSKDKDEVQKKVDNSRRALQTIKTKIELEEQEQGGPLDKNAGLGSSLTKRYIEVGLSAGVDWRVIFRNICKDKPKKTFTLAQPNQDYMNMGMTLAERRRIGKPERVSKVKFAIDVSGSVSQKELQVTLSEIANIFNYFKLDGELLYWSTMVGDAGMFSSLKDMLQISPVSDGGTDARCVFDYLAGKTKVHGKVESDRVRDMKAIFIITDGCFSMNFSDYTEMFGRRVVWLITGVRGNTITFNPPFGRVLALDIDQD